MPEEKPRTWVPFLVAVTVAVLAVAALLIINALRSDLEPAKREAAEACEAAYEAQAPSGPGIVAGEIFAASEWRELAELLHSLGFLPDGDAEVSGEVASARDDQAAALAASGQDVMTIVWQFADQSQGMCVAQIANGAVAPPVDVTVSLGEPGVTPSPEPTE